MNDFSLDDVSNDEKKLQSLISMREKLVQNKARLDAHSENKRAELAQHLKEIRALGFDPDTVDEDIPKLKAVVDKKIEVLTEEYAAADRLFENALKNIG